MKTFKKVSATVVALTMAASLAACGGASSETTTTTTASSETETTTAEVASIAGTYRFDYTDPYGDVTTFTVTLKEDGSFNIMTLGAMGSGVYNGTEWTDNGDGTFTTGAADAAIDTEFVAEDGTITWKIDGTNAVPVDYVEPTEFIEKTSDPANAAEAVGVYVFGMVNDWGTTVPYILWVNADGSYNIHMNNQRTGLHSYSGTWTYSQDNIIACGPAAYEGDTPQGDFFDADNEYSSEWYLYADGTCTPTNYEGQTAEVSLSEQPAEIYPANADLVGIYLFGMVNDWGTTVPYVLWINADGTAAVHMNNSRTGLHSYYASEWTVADDGTVSLGSLTYEGDTPQGDFFDADNGYASTWTLNTDGTAIPTNYTGSTGDIDTNELPASIYPAGNATVGTFYFGMVNDWGTTVPYILKIKSDGTCQIVMDNQRTGVHIYTGTITDNGDGTITTSELTYEGDTPQGDFFDADNGYASTWKLNTDGTAVPTNYEGTVVDVDTGSLTDEAKEAVQAFK